MPHWPGVSEPLAGARLRYLSLGAGVQSSTLALMSARGDLKLLDFAIFSDTGGESAKVYAWLDWLEAQLPFPLIRVKRADPNLADLSTAVASGSRPLKGSPIPPWYLRDAVGRLSMHPKQCSKEYKTRVVIAAIREMLGFAPGQRIGSHPIVEQWVGISQDEVERMKRSEAPWIQNRWPLIEEGMTRQSCLRWMAERQYPRPPRSSCVYCPFRTNAEWREMRDREPDDFAEAIRVDEAIRLGWTGMEGQAFAHRSGRPLAEADLSDGQEGQMTMFDCDDACTT
jgi:hypothetical protein